MSYLCKSCLTTIEDECIGNTRSRKDHALELTFLDPNQVLEELTMGPRIKGLREDSGLDPIDDL